MFVDLSKNTFPLCYRIQFPFATTLLSFLFSYSLFGEVCYKKKRETKGDFNFSLLCHSITVKKLFLLFERKRDIGYFMSSVEINSNLSQLLLGQVADRSKLSMYLKSAANSQRLNWFSDNYKSTASLNKSHISSLPKNNHYLLLKKSCC